MPICDSMDIEQQVALYTASYQLIQEIVSKYAPAYYVNLDRKHGVIIFLPGDMPSGSPDLMQILKQTGHSLYNYYKTRLKCGIGTRVRAALSLSDSIRRHGYPSQILWRAAIRRSFATQVS